MRIPFDVVIVVREIVSLAYHRGKSLTNAVSYRAVEQSGHSHFPGAAKNLRLETWIRTGVFEPLTLRSKKPQVNPLRLGPPIVRFLSRKRPPSIVSRRLINLSKPGNPFTVAILIPTSMRRSLLWVITLALPFLFLGLIAYLLKDSVLSLDWSQLEPGDIVNLVALAIGFFGAFVAIASLFVAVTQLQQAIQDSKDQQVSLESSRKQLEAVVMSLNEQQKIQALSLESSKSLVALQERAIETTSKLQEVLGQSLTTTKSILSLQEAERNRVIELASRNPRLHFAVDDKAIEGDLIQTTVTVDANNQGFIEVYLINTGLAPLFSPIFIATVSMQEVTINFKNRDVDSRRPYRTQLSGMSIPDVLPFSTSNNVFNNTLRVVVPPPISSFDIMYGVSGNGLTTPFRGRIIVQVKRI